MPTSAVHDHDWYAKGPSADRAPPQRKERSDRRTIPVPLVDLAGWRGTAGQPGWEHSWLSQGSSGRVDFGGEPTPRDAERGHVFQAACETAALGCPCRRVGRCWPSWAATRRPPDSLATAARLPEILVGRVRTHVRAAPVEVHARRRRNRSLNHKTTIKPKPAPVTVSGSASGARAALTSSTSWRGVSF